VKPENHGPIPFDSFAEQAPEPNPETKKNDVVWFLLDDDRAAHLVAGLCAEFKGDRGTKSRPLPPAKRRR
jgi:putative SOS response-associated peptidase YedK